MKKFFSKYKNYIFLFFAKKIILVLFLLYSGSLGALDLFQDEKNVHIVVNNRVLAKVNNKAITVVDVMKKMDVVFYKGFPEYANSKMARHQFYTVNWKQVLQDCIDKELILADAEENKMELSNGDIRQEIEHLFGPNIIANLDKIGMTLDEAWEIVKSDIIIRRMMMARVNQKASRNVYPKDVKAAYEDYVNKFERTNEWVYQLISVRDPDGKTAKAAAANIYGLLSQQAYPVDKIVEVAKEQGILEPTTTVNLSKDLRHKDKELSPAYKEILEKLQDGTFSQPSAQKSRDKSTVYRIFYLKQKEAHEPLPFTEVANKLKEKLIMDAVDKETVVYLDKLHERFAVDLDAIMKNIPADFQPYVLKK
jgi:hypothetical protein